ncbi:hypothetical protein GDO81_025716 [Engystomops pustulosus]|uniref:Uncharacterized protein n=1 Tax=Engystomops pustulosus TaxID=76066 RepID=A0AAV6YRY4_ENGPU|nr:hypothetical protein GDO81_025716 [Engystomops pustulosus]
MIKLIRLHPCNVVAAGSRVSSHTKHKRRMKGEVLQSGRRARNISSSETPHQTKASVSGRKYTTKIHPDKPETLLLDPGTGTEESSYICYPWPPYK